MVLSGDVKHVSRYLNNLVARQMNRASLVQPRLPSLFEPPAPGSALLHEWRGARYPLAVDTVESETGLDVRLEIRDSIETSSGSPSSRFHSPSDEAASTVWRGRQQIASSSWPSADLAPDEKGQASPQAAEGQTATPAITHRPPANITPRSSTAPEEVAAPQQQNVRQPSPQHGAATEQQDKANEQTTSPRLKQSTIDSTPVDSTKDSLVVQPRVVLLDTNRKEAKDSPLPALPPISEPPPVINVTIGRIEVRANTTPPTTPPKPPAKSLMSLDEYLRRRTKGGSDV